MINDQLAHVPLPVVVGILRNHLGEILIALRPPHVLMPGVWEFPGGKIERGETPLQALDREFQEELGVRVLRATHLLDHCYTYPDRIVSLSVWEIGESEGVPYGAIGQEIRWVPVDALPTYTFPRANEMIIEQLSGP